MKTFAITYYRKIKYEKLNSHKLYAKEMLMIFNFNNKVLVQFQTKILTLKLIKTYIN